MYTSSHGATAHSSPHPLGALGTNMQGVVIITVFHQLFPIIHILIKFEVSLNFAAHIALLLKLVEVGRKVLKPLIVLVSIVVLNRDTIRNVCREARRLVVYKDNFAQVAIIQELSQIFNDTVRPEWVLLAFVA